MKTQKDKILLNHLYHKYENEPLYEENVLNRFDLVRMKDQELAYLTLQMIEQINATTQAIDEMEIHDQDRHFYLTDYENELASYDSLVDEWEERGVEIRLDGTEFDYSNSLDGSISERFKTCLVEVSSGEEKSETLSTFKQQNLKRGF